MDEDFKDVTTSSKHVAIIFFFFVVALLVGGYFFVFRPIHFSVKTVEVELGGELSEDVKDYLGSYGGEEHDYTLDVSKVDPQTIGDYEYTISNGKLTKKGIIKVVDTKAPEFTLQDMTIEEGSTEYFLGDFLATCEDSSKPCLVSLKNDKDEDKFKTPGTHTIEIEVADVIGNKGSAKATLIVVPKGEYTDPRSLDLEYTSTSKKNGEFEGTIYKKLDVAINASSDEARDEMSIISTIDLENYVSTNHPGYRIVSSEIIELYNKSSYITGYAIELVITNGKEKTVYVDGTKISVSDSGISSDNDEE